MMKIIQFPNKETWAELLKRPQYNMANLDDTVSGIFQEIKQKGDWAVKKYTEILDGCVIMNSKVTRDELTKASVSKQLLEAMTIAKNNIEKFHLAQKRSKIEVETTPGVRCWQESRPIQNVGLYIPGGTAPLFSTVLMLAVPAKIAGCENIILCTPPNKNGEIDPAILEAARLCGITQIIKVGGIQAIGAMTFGTESIPKVDKIFGPGNQYVTAAKQYAMRYGVAIDMPAGPSELLIFADDTANASFVASDLLSQAEHGADSQVILVSTSEELLTSVSTELIKQLEKLPRKEIAKKALNHSKAILVEDNEQALQLINYYAPEHFIVCAKEEDYFTTHIQNAGSVFVGNYTPESAGDYASGTNHTLPTNGYARQYSGVGLDSFMKRITFQKITREGLQSLGPHIESMAKAEGLDAHKNAVTLRLNEQGKFK